MSTRKKKAVVSPASTNEVDKVMAEFAETDARIESVTAKMDEEITAIREKHGTTLTGLKEQHETLFTRLQLWAEKTPELFEKKKSKDLVHGTVGFRTGTPKLKNKKGITWAAVLELLKAKGKKYIRSKQEVDRESLLADRNDAKVQTLMKDIHVEVVQEETFYIDLKKEEASEIAA